MKFRPNSLSVFLMVSGSLALISGCGSKGPVSADNSASETRKRPGIEKKQQKAEPAEFSLKKRAEAFHPSYDLELITFGLEVNRNITPSSSTVNFEAQLDKFLKNHQHIKFHTLQDWFQRVFPKYPDTSSPYYLSLYDDQNQPISHPLDDSKILTQTELAAGIDTLIDKCNRASYSADRPAGS
ncbi:MAG: hypothetical protein HYX41_00655 [Bdellovibrio sp.]|nr:hypothetical protein [Bdellovibrio sp.]